MVTMRTRPVVLSLIILVAALVVSSCGGGGGSAGLPPSTPPAPGAPTTVYALASSGTVTVRWTAMPFASSYTVLRSDTSPTTGYAAKASGIGSTLYTDLTVSNGHTYYYVVQSHGTAGVSAYSSPASATPQVVAGALLTGTVNYEDKIYDRYGFTGVTSLKAVRYATVELVDASSPFPQLAAAVTSSTGTFSFDVSTYGGKSVYVRVEADATSPAGEVLVKDISKALYAVKSATVQVANGAAIDLGIAISTSNAAAGAFNIVDVYTSSAQFVSSLSLSSVPTLTVYWPNALGTYYCDPTNTPAQGCANYEGIYVLQDPPASPAYDTDEYDDDVLWHEYGHFIAYHYSKDDSPGQDHAFWMNDYDMRLTWSEGWGDFFETAVKRWLNATAPGLLSTAPGLPLSQYVDTATTPGYYYNSLTIADPEAPGTNTTCGVDANNRPNECVYSTNEIAVANVLWTLMEGNGVNGGYGMKPLWDVITSPTFTATTPRINVESFFDGLVSANTASMTDIQTVFAARLLDYRDDSYEAFADATIVTTNTYTGVPQMHTLFSGASGTHFDMDYVAFSVPAAGTYTITASSIRNGTDPAIEIYDPLDNLVTYATSTFNLQALPSFNGDIYGYHVNSGDTFAAAVTLTTSTTGTYHALIRPYAAMPNYVGRYGNYTLTITP